MKAEYTEVWVPAAIVPLVRFADRVRAISSTRLDSVLDEVPDGLKDALAEFDEIVSWYGANRPEFRTALGAAHKRVTFLEALPNKAWRGHAGDFFAKQVGAPMGSVPMLDVGETLARGSVVIHPFSGSARKNWPLERYRDLAQKLGERVEWTAGPHEELAGATRFENLMDLARWMKGAAAYVGNDSGISHLAAAIGMRTVVLFGPTEPEVWAPRGENVTVLRRRSLSELDADRVWSALTTS